MKPPKAHEVNKMVPNVVSKKQPRNGTPLGRQKVRFRTTVPHFRKGSSSQKSVTFWIILGSLLDLTCRREGFHRHFKKKSKNRPILVPILGSLGTVKMRHWAPLGPSWAPLGLPAGHDSPKCYKLTSQMHHQSVIKLKFPSKNTNLNAK